MEKAQISLNTPPRWVEIALFISIAVLLIYSNWSLINRVNYEIGDLAANSLLIQDAKSLHLLTGNYSRTGFHHPGPAILYVLALGEAIFYDLLHIVPSPFSGQLLAVALYTAFWTALVYRLLYRGTKSIATSAVGLSTFLLITALNDHQFFNGIWFPHLYYFPFAAFIFASVRLTDGFVDSLPSFALSLGFLVNGHVSFVAITGFILLIAVGLNYLLYAKIDASKLILSKAFFAKHSRMIAWSASLACAFFIPLLIKTVIDFPGPVRDYIAFSGTHSPNTLVSAIKYVAQYWGGLVPMLLAMLMSTTVLFSHLTTTLPYRAAMATVASATFAMLFYAKFGIDMLQYKYIGLFYYAVPGLLGAIATALIYEALNAKYKVVLIFIAMAVSAITIYRVSPLPKGYAGTYDDTSVPSLYSSLKAQQNGDRLIFNLTGGDGWETVWINVVGLEAYAKRKGDVFFCINKGWNILFTKADQCSDEEVLHSHSMLIVRKTSATALGNLKSVAEGMGLSFYQPQSIAGEGMLSVASNRSLYDSTILASGWSPTESEIVWSEGNRAFLSIPVNQGFSGKILLDLSAFLPHSNSKQFITVSCGATKGLKVQFSAEDNRKTVTIPVKNLGNAEVPVEISIATPYSPRTEGVSTDPRLLGVALHGIELRSN